MFPLSRYWKKPTNCFALIGGAAAEGGLALIAIIALAVLAVKYRIAQIFMNRNKVETCTLPTMKR